MFLLCEFFLTWFYTQSKAQKYRQLKKIYCHFNARALLLRLRFSRPRLSQPLFSIANKITQKNGGGEVLRVSAFLSSSEH
jgi:hypothetical protein